MKTRGVTPMWTHRNWFTLLPEIAKQNSNKTTQGPQNADFQDTGHQAKRAAVPETWRHTGEWSPTVALRNCSQRVSKQGTGEGKLKRSPIDLVELKALS